MPRKQRKIVTLCGSVRFYEAFQRANYEESQAGHIVLSVGFYPAAKDQPHCEALGCTPEQKLAVDELHFDKIAMSDEILVLNVDGYVGDSTRNEIAMAVLLCKDVRWLEPERGGPDWFEEHARDIGLRVAKHMEAGR